MDFKQFFVGFLLIALVTLGLVAFLTGMQKNYSVTDSLANNSEIGYITNLQNNVTEIFQNSNKSDSGLYSTTPSVDAGGLMVTTIVGAGKLLSSSSTLVYHILVGGLSATLGIDPVVIMILEALLVGVLVLMAWSLWRLGR